MAAVAQETDTIPIVFVVVSDPIGSRFVESLPRPGKNITGFINIESSLGGKWLELLKEIAPRISRVSVLFNLGHGTPRGILRTPVRSRCPIVRGSAD